MNSLNKFWIFVLLKTCLTVNIIAALTCSLYQWKCADGNQCIEFDDMCNGEANCKDSSDETSLVCAGVHCPSFAFRCSYGACVDSNSECNNVKDCVDNSDERTPNCPRVLEKHAGTSECRDGYLKCKLSGECLPGHRFCDGAVDCGDKSDETLERCSLQYCPSYGFRCLYGGCVDGSSECDGHPDCADNSDENPALCGHSTIVANTTPTATPSSNFPNSCWVPEDLPNMFVYYEADGTTEVSKGSYVDSFMAVIYRCQRKYTLEGKTSNQCVEGKWIDDHPVCRKYCSEVPLSGITIKPTCQLLGQTISCKQPLRPQTTAQIHCALGYRRPDRVVIDFLRCDEDGEWDYHPFMCEQVCGEEVPDTVPYIVGGQKENITKVPWHVGVYSNIRDRDIFSQICGGTIINAKLVISAAHCFYNTGERRFHSPTNYKIGAGKYYRGLNDVEPIRVQILNVAQILYKQQYEDYMGLFDQDIALLALAVPIKFDFYIKPICLETNLDYNEKHVPSGLVGKVAGWGLETPGGDSSPELKTIEIPTIGFDECRESMGVVMQPFITGDKFCAGQTTGEVVCQGDSGGGFVYSKKVGNKKLNFLWGIVSAAAKSGESCDSSKYTLFTNIQIHIEMIKHYESENIPK